MNLSGHAVWRKLTIGCAVLLLLLLGAAGAVGWRTWYAATVETVELQSSPEGGACMLGAPLTLEFRFRVPWGQSIRQTSFQTDQGWIAVRPPELRSRRWHWGSTEQTVALTLRAFRTGSGSPGSLTATWQQPYLPPERREAPLTVTLPAFSVTAAPVDPQAELPLADEFVIPHKSRVWPWIAGAVAVLLLCLTGAWLWRRRRKLPPPPAPWEIAARDLANLRRTAASGGRSAAWCFARLTDVVRDYLTRRFQLRADRQTTEEFLHAMARGNSPLGAEEERTLEAFLQQADLIKFAGFPPERGALEQAVDHAEQLVRNTTPATGGDAAKEGAKC